MLCTILLAMTLIIIVTTNSTIIITISYYYTTIIIPLPQINICSFLSEHHLPFSTGGLLVWT